MPRFTPEQVRRRQIIAGVLVVLLLLAIGGCTAGLIGAIRGGEGGPRTQRGDFRADDEAMTVAPLPPEAPVAANLPEGVQLAPDEVMGVDVSAHQQQIAWDEVAADGVTFAYIKATEGSNFTDASFRANWDGAVAAGITPGAYHYFTLCSPGAEQAADFLAAAPPDDSALPPALDLEFDGACEERPEAEHAQAEIDAFTAAVEKEWGRRLVIYSSREWREHYGLPAAEGRPAWLFSEGQRPEQEDWAVWQLRFDGTVAGIEGGVDIDVLRAETLREHAEIPEGERELEEAPAG